MIKQINNLTKLEAMLLILLEGTSTRQVSFTHIILDFFRLEVMSVESVISPVTFDYYYPDIKDLNEEEIQQLMSKKLNF